MQVLFAKPLYVFSIASFINQNSLVTNKLCFKKKKTFLTGKVTPSNYLTTKLSRHGLILKNRKNLYLYFLNTVLKGLCKLPDNNEFKSLFKLYKSFNDINRVIL